MKTKLNITAGILLLFGFLGVAAQVPKPEDCTPNECARCVARNCMWIVTTHDERDCRPDFIGLEGKLLGVVTSYTKHMCSTKHPPQEKELNLWPYLFGAVCVLVGLLFLVALYFFKMGKISEKNFKRIVAVLPKQMQALASIATDVVMQSNDGVEGGP